jgi:hypothetical protein
MMPIAPQVMLADTQDIKNSSSEDQHKTAIEIAPFQIAVQSNSTSSIKEDRNIILEAPIRTAIGIMPFQIAVQSNATTNTTTKKPTTTANPLLTKNKKCGAFNFKNTLKKCCRGDKSEGPQFFSKSAMNACSHRKMNNQAGLVMTEYYMNKLQNIKGQSTLDITSNRASKCLI